MKVLVLVCLVAAAATGCGGVALEEEFGFVDVRPGAHMFWVMYHVNHTADYTTFPLIMWLQGGPGSSGVGYGNFDELGPKDVNGNSREYAWTESANLMFVDNPVGTGYSYVDSLANLTTDNAQIATDLVVLVKDVFTNHPDMQKMPFFVFCESYGGKMAVDFAIAFDEAIKNGEVVSDFRGIALGDSWISPMDYVNTWGTFLYQMGFVNREGLAEIDASAALAQAAVDAEKWVEATNQWSSTESVVDSVAHGVNFYNVLAVEDIYLAKKKTQSHASGHLNLSFMTPTIRRLYNNHVGRLQGKRVGDPLYNFMNGPQKEHWGIPESVTWDSQGGYVFDRLAGDFMKPVVDSVVKLLTETDLKVNVFNGNLDLICDTPGTYRWIENMEWPDKVNFMAAGTRAVYISSYSSPAALVQSSGKFSLYTIFRSGHMVPIDVPEMGLKLVDTIVAAAAATHQHLPPSRHESAKHESAKHESAKHESAKQEPTRHESAKQEPTKHESAKQEPTRHESAKQEPTKHESAKQEPTKHESAKQEPTKHESAKQEPTRHESAKQEPTRHESAKQEPTKHESAKQEPTKHESAKQEPTRHESAKQEPTKHESAKQEPTKHESAKQEPTRHESAKQEPTKHESAKQEPTRHESAKQEPTRHESAKQEPTRHESAKHESAKHELAKHEPTKHESAKQEPTRHESAKQEPTRHESAKQEPTKHESAKQEPTRHESAKQEPTRHESAKQEPTRHESAKQEPTRHESAKQEPTRHESAKQEPTKHESAKQEPTKHESAKQEPTKHESAKQEPTRHESAKQEPTRHESAKQKAQQKGIGVRAVNSVRSRVAATHLHPATPTGKRFGKMGPTFHGPRRG